MDKSTPLFSIIIPVYNAAEYLPRCIDSVLKQHYTGFELILINDGSTDSSLQICQDAAASDLRIAIIDQLNQGVSTARNAGLTAAKSQYITFIDADDFINVDYLHQFSEEIKKNGSDLIISGLTKYFGENDKRNVTYILPDSASLDDIPILDRKSLLSGPFAKCFKASLIQEHNLRFDKRFHFGEDAVFNLSFANLIESLAALNYAGYNYFQTPGESLVKKKYPYEITLEFAETITALRNQLHHKFPRDTAYADHIAKERTHYVISAILSNYAAKFKKKRKERLAILKKHQTQLRSDLHLLPSGKYYQILKIIFTVNNAFATDALLQCLAKIKK